MNCPNCGKDSVVCQTKVVKPVYKTTAYIVPIIAIIVGVAAIALFLYANGSDEVYSSRKVTRALIVGIVFPIWGVYRLWKMKRATQEVTECTCSSCGAVFDGHQVESAPVLQEGQELQADRPTDTNQQA